MAGRIAPFWLRKLKPYPLYWPGNPQLRIFLPTFWMKMIKPRQPVPPDHVHFVVHPQMTRMDVKNYLEKVYQVPVLTVKTEVKRGKERKHPIRNHIQQPHPDYKVAYVQLAGDQKFEFPDIGVSAANEKQFTQDMEGIKKAGAAYKQENWQHMNQVPRWFL